VHARAVVVFAAVTTCIVAYTSGPLLRIRTWWGYDDPLPDDPVIVVVFSVIAVLSFAVLAVGRRLLPAWLVISGAALAAWLTITTAWSFDRSDTGRETLLIAGTLAFGAAAATLLDLRRLAWAVWVGLHVGLAWSFLAIQANRPGTIDRNNDWAGIYFNRNSLGLYAALAALGSMVLAADLIQRRGVTPRWHLGVGLAVLVAATVADARLLVGSDSATPIGALVGAALAVVGALVARRAVGAGMRQARVVGLGAAIAVTVGSVGFATRASWLGVLGRDTDLTGRTGLWSLAWDSISRRPIHGFGYLSAWGERPFRRQVRQETGRRLTSAHNTVVEMLLGGGFVGLLVFLCFVGGVCWLVSMTAVGRRSLVALWPLAMVVFVLVENLTETLFVSNHLTVALLPAAATAAWIGRADDAPVGARKASAPGM